MTSSSCPKGREWLSPLTSRAKKEPTRVVAPLVKLSVESFVFWTKKIRSQEFRQLAMSTARERRPAGKEKLKSKAKIAPVAHRNARTRTEVPVGCVSNFMSQISKQNSNFFWQTSESHRSSIFKSENRSFFVESQVLSSPKNSQAPDSRREIGETHLEKIDFCLPLEQNFNCKIAAHDFFLTSKGNLEEHFSSRSHLNFRSFRIKKNTGSPSPSLQGYTEELETPRSKALHSRFGPPPSVPDPEELSPDSLHSLPEQDNSSPMSVVHHQNSSPRRRNVKRFFEDSEGRKSPPRANSTKSKSNRLAIDLVSSDKFDEGPYRSRLIPCNNLENIRSSGYYRHPSFFSVEPICCPLIRYVKFQKPLINPIEGSRIEGDFYRSYWMDCITRLLESPNAQDEDPGYYPVLMNKVGIDIFPKFVWDGGDSVKYMNFLNVMSKVRVDIESAHQL